MTSRRYVTLGCVLLTACFEPVGGPLRDAAQVGKDAAASQDAGTGDAAADAPDTGGDDAADQLPDAAGELPDAGSDAPDASSPDACTPETDSQLCSVLGLTCGPGRGVDLCGVVRDVDCGPCGTLPLCGPGVTAPCERICSSAGYCWAHPQPMGGSVKGIDGVAADDVWFVGAFGATLHWDGQSLKRFESGTQANLAAVKAFSANDVWAVGASSTFAPYGTIHWDGTAWRPVALYGDSLWGSSPDDLWIGRDAHWDGIAWTGQPRGIALFATMWGTSPTDIWSYELGKYLYHYDGTSWHAPPAHLAGNPLAATGGLAGTASNDVWAGSGDVFAHWDGSSWTSATSPSTKPMTSAFSRGQEVWVHFGDETYRRSAAGWELALTLPANELAERMWTDGTEFWFGRPSLLHWDGAKFVSFQQPSLRQVGQVWAPAADNVWSAAAGPTLGHWDGKGWSAIDLSSFAEKLYAVGGTGSDDVWAVGQAGAAVHWDGTTWSLKDTGTTGDLSTVFATARDDLWAAGAAGLQHWDGVSWKRVSSPSGTIVSLWGSSPDDLWAASNTSSLAHYDAMGWSTVPLPCASDFKITKVWGTGPQDVWAFGDNWSQSVALHWDGSTWTSFSLEGSGYGRFVACGRGSLGFAFSESEGSAWNGSVFEPIAFELLLWESRLQACSVDAAGDLWLFLQDGSVLQRSGRWR